MEVRICSPERMEANTAKVLQIGVMPQVARPAAVPIMLCSAMPML